MGKFFELQFLTGHIHYLLFIVLMMTGLFIVVEKQFSKKDYWFKYFSSFSIYVLCIDWESYRRYSANFPYGFKLSCRSRLQCKQFYIQIHYRMF